MGSGPLAQGEILICALHWCELSNGFHAAVDMALLWEFSTDGKLAIAGVIFVHDGLSPEHYASG